MSESIKVLQADIHTATVDVAILRISGKQVTLAVYRQLKEESPIDSDGHFRGMPWGTINYHPPKECSTGADGRHLHVVWQLGNELRRGTMTIPVRLPPWPVSADAWLLAASHQGVWRPPEEWMELHRNFRCHRRHDLHVSSPSGSFMVEVPEGLLWHWQGHYPVHPDAPAESHGELWSEVVREVAAIYERRDRLVKRWEEVSALPQLFIAV